MSKRKKVDTTRYASYARCSTDDQKEKDYSTVDAQQEINRSFVAGRNGILVKEYADEGKTGKNLNRPVWKQMLEDAKAGLFDVVCVTYMSRLGRGDAFVIAEHELGKCGVRVEMVKEHFSDDMAGRTNKKVTRFVDGIYVDMVREWTMTKMQAMVEKGYVTGATPFGYTTEHISDPALAQDQRKLPPKRLVPHPENAPIVRSAYSIFAETGSYARTRDFLTASTGRAWSLQSTVNLLGNEAFIGVQKFGAWVNRAAHEAIVSTETWEVVRSRDTSKVRKVRSDATEKRQNGFYLRGLVRCSACNSAMTPATHHGRASDVAYYECVNCTKGKNACPIKRINADSLHTAIVNEIMRAAASPTRTTEIIREAVKLVQPGEKLDAQVQAVTRRLRGNQRETENLVRAISAGGKTVRPLIARLEELEAERASLEGEKGGLERQIVESKIQRPDAEQVREYWDRFSRLWKKATDAEKSKLLPLVVEGVELTEKERGFFTLAFAPENPRQFNHSSDGNVSIRSNMGAQARVNTTNPVVNPRYYGAPLYVPPGGQLRKRIPRPSQTPGL